MSQYKVNWMENKKSKDGKEYIKATLDSETNERFEASVWPDFSQYSKMAPGATVEGVIRVKGEYKNLVDGNLGPKPESLRHGAPRGQYGGFKTQQVKELMQDKNRNIEAAQDRSAWMWAKTNAAQLLAGKSNADMKIKSDLMTLEGISDAVLNLATLIYNGEPTEPFSSKPKVVSTGDDISHDDINAELDAF